MKNNLDKQYQNLLQDILDNGVRKEGRNGATYSVFGRTIRHDMSEGFPLLTTKKMYFKGIVTELMWFLRGRSDLRYLLQHGNKIWVGDAYKKYVDIMLDGWEDGDEIPLQESWFIDRILNDDEFSQKWGDLGRIYGKQWREWRNTFIDGEDSYGVEYIDQIQNIINMLRNSPDSRRMLVNAWNVGELDDMALPPCHYGFQVWTRELTVEERSELFAKEIEVPVNMEEHSNPHAFFDDKNIRRRAISLLWNQRSCDTPLGIPFNIASYGLLLMMIADEVNMVPEDLIGNLGDTHIYNNQIEGVREQLTRQYHPLPTVNVTNGINATLDDIELINYISEDKINFPLSN